jgi:hypothetical protein
MSLDFTNAIPHATSGFGPRHKVFASGRLGVTLNDFGGLYEIIFWGKQPDESSPLVFKGDAASSYTRLFRSQLLTGDDAWNLDFEDTEILSCGYVSHFTAPGTGVKVRHTMTLVHEAIVFTVEVLENPRQLPLRQRFEQHGYTRTEHPMRTLSPWQTDGTSGWTFDLVDSSAIADSITGPAAAGANTSPAARSPGAHTAARSSSPPAPTNGGSRRSGFCPTSHRARKRSKIPCART